MTPLYILAATAVLVAAVLAAIKMIRRWTFFTVACLAIVVCFLAFIKMSQFAAMAAMPQVVPPETVTTAVAAEQSWVPTISAVGSLVPFQGVTLAAEMDGKVTRIEFESGASVSAGQVLLQLDVASEEAQLRSAEAAADLAKISLDRSRELLASKTVAQSDFDQAEAQYKQATAQADNIRTLIEKKTIRAPFAGKAGIRLVNLGQILKAGDQVVSLQAVDPIYADFNVPQQQLGQLVPGLPVDVSTDVLPGQAVAGKITAVNPDVDAASRNVNVQATLANPSEKLRPGMFVTVTVMLPERGKVLVIPETSVLYAPYGDSVFVVEEKKDPASGKMAKFLRQQFVRLGEHRGDFVAVADGLKPGDEVVTTGTFKLRNGEAVIVNNELSPKFQLNPNPKNS